MIADASLFGYDQGVMGGLLTLSTFVETFPEMDTVSKHLTAEQKSKNSTIQGVAMLSLISSRDMVFSARTYIYLPDGPQRTI